MDVTILNAAGINFRITSDMIKEMIEKSEIKSIQDLTVHFTQETLALSGKLNIMPIKIPFEIVLRPTCAKGRSIYFTVDKFAPINAIPIKNKLLQQPPILKYEDPYLEINLDGIEALKKIPYGHIKEIGIQDQSFIVKIGF